MWELMLHRFMIRQGLVNKMILQSVVGGVL